MSDKPSNRDLYQWDGGDMQPPRPDVPPQPDVTTRFRDEVYDPHARGRRPEVIQPIRTGDNLNQFVVYGDVYINQSDCRCRQRCDGRTEYYGRGYDYNQYCDPRQRQAVPYYEYGYRQVQPDQWSYNRNNYEHAWQRGRGYDYGGGYSQGGGYYRKEGDYSRDSVSGGRDGYSSDRERYRGGYETWNGGRAQPYYNGGCFGGGGYSGGGYEGGGVNDWDRAGQVFDFALRGFDAWAGYDIARRHARGQYSGGGGRYYDQGGGQRGGYGDRRNYRHAWQR